MIGRVCGWQVEIVWCATIEEVRWIPLELSRTDVRLLIKSAIAISARRVSELSLGGIRKGTSQ